MTLVEKIDGDLKSALKAQDQAKLSTLRMLKSEIGNVAIQKGKKSLEDGDVLEVIQKMMKQRQESVDAFTKGNRMELAQKEAQEKELLKSYMPPAMGEAELKGIIQAAIQELSASGPSALGSVMKAVLPKVNGRADGKLVNQLVAQLLQGA